jgi:hypothetical protein|tara:strand:+ start:831 stop:1076 length:246 start_codon:yes stop_codon:yes gene_type:complete
VANKKCEMHHYILEAPNGKQAIGICKKCGHKKTHSNINERVVTKRVVKKGRKPQNVVGIRLGREKSPHFNGEFGKGKQATL